VSADLHRFLPTTEGSIRTSKAVLGVGVSRWALIVFMLLMSIACVARGADGGDLGLKEGDVLFQTSRSAQSRAIQLATHSKWSHMGMLVREDNKWVVLEAVQPVKMTPLRDWIRRGQGGRMVAKRLRNGGRPLDTATLARMRQVGSRFLGRPYDLAFEWDDRRIYCSELVWKVYKEGVGIELGELQRLNSFDLSHPAVVKKLRERYGSRIPLDEPVISPQAIFECPLLNTVLER